MATSCCPSAAGSSPPPTSDPNGRYQAGRYGTTTIATIGSSFGEHYLGWTQPWFNR